MGEKFSAGKGLREIPEVLSAFEPLCPLQISACAVDTLTPFAAQ
jgi:hypothetical protein